jgi:1,4-alpha-glucan branching enzyme
MARNRYLGRMPGDEWQKFANLRLLYSYMFTHPGAKLLFQGAEFGQSGEWNFETSLDWHLLQYGYHDGIKQTITALNKLYKSCPALYEKQFTAEGFEWINYSDNENAVLAFVRKGNDPKNELVVVCNLTPVIREGYRIGVPGKGKLTEIFNSDETQYGGSGVGNAKPVKADAIPWNGREFSASLVLPPLAVVVFKTS